MSLLDLLDWSCYMLNGLMKVCRISSSKHLIFIIAIP